MNKSEKRLSIGRWLLRFAPFIALQLAYAMLAYQLPGILDLFKYSIAWYKVTLYIVIIGSTVVCETAVCLTIAGLLGRHWLVGFASGSILMAIQALLYLGGLPPEERLGGAWSVLCIPAVFLTACIPLFAMRRISGWCFSLTAPDTERRWSLEGLLLATLAIACSFVGFRNFYFAFLLSEDIVGEEASLEFELWLAGGGTSLFAGVLLLSVVIPLLWVWYRERSIAWKFCAQLVLLAIVAVTTSGVVYLIQLLAGSQGLQIDDAFFYGSVLSLSAIPPYLLNLYTLHFAGLTLRKPGSTDKAKSAPGTQAEDKSAPVQPESFIDPTAKAKPRWAPRILAGVFLIGTALVTVNLRSAVQLAENRIKQLEELTEFADSNGGMFFDSSSDSFYPEGRGPWSLMLWEGATDADLRRFTSVKLHWLCIADANVSADAIIELEGLAELERVELGSPTDIGKTLAFLCSNSSNLRTIAISDSELSLSDLVALQKLESDQIELYFDRCHFAEADGKGFDGLPDSTVLVDAYDCELTDALVGGWISGRMVDVSLCRNELNGDIDFSAFNDDPQILRSIDLSDNPLDDDLFGKGLAGLTIDRLTLNETTLTDRFFGHLKNVKSVHSLELNSEGFTEQGLAQAEPNGLQELYMELPQFTGHCFKDWHPEKLRVLSLEGSSADDETMRYLKLLPSLSVLNISNTKISAKAVLESGISPEVEINVEFRQFNAVEITQLRAMYRKLGVVRYSN